MERWQSGRLRLIVNQVNHKRFQGFESPSLNFHYYLHIKSDSLKLSDFLLYAISHVSNIYKKTKKQQPTLDKLKKNIILHNQEYRPKEDVE